MTNNEFEQLPSKLNSKKKRPVWIWAIVLIIFLVVLKESFHAFNSKDGWSAEKTKDVYQSLNEGISKMPMDSPSKKNLTECVEKKLKDKYPQGLDGVNDDSLKNITSRFISACSVETNINLGWSSAMDTAIRNKLMESPSMKMLSTENQNIYCNCYINKLKQLYPKGLTEDVRESTADSITNACSKEIKK